MNSNDLTIYQIRLAFTRDDPFKLITPDLTYGQGHFSNNQLSLQCHPSDPHLVCFTTKFTGTSFTTVTHHMSFYHIGMLSHKITDITYTP